VPIAEILEACKQMHVPCPEPRYWRAVKLGWNVERVSLPVAKKTTPTAIVIKKGQSCSISFLEQEAVQLHPNIPDDLKNAHRFVKRAHRALTQDTYLHNGFVYGRLAENPLQVEVSPEQVVRAMRIFDAIIKGAIEKGGRFKQGPESWRWRLSMGKQSVWFSMTEARKRLTLDLNEEERAARGISRWDKYEWKGAGLLRFKIIGEHLRDITWSETTRERMEEIVPKIINYLTKAEALAEENLKLEKERKRIEIEAQRLRDIEGADNLKSRKNERLSNKSLNIGTAHRN
jgi:hypothetical protein